MLLVTGRLEEEETFEELEMLDELLFTVELELLLFTVELEVTGAVVEWLVELGLEEVTLEETALLFDELRVVLDELTPLDELALLEELDLCEETALLLLLPVCVALDECSLLDLLSVLLVGVTDQVG